MEVIHILEKEGGIARTGHIAKRMDVKPPTVTEMLHKLREEGYANYRPFMGVTLTEKGRKEARRLDKRHEVIADFIKLLGIEREVAEIDACELEHHISNKTARKLEKFVMFVQNAPKSPKWVGHFRRYCETGERLHCDNCSDD